MMYWLRNLQYKVFKPYKEIVSVLVDICFHLICLLFLLCKMTGN